LKELLEMKLPQVIANQKKTVLAMVGVLCVLWFAQTYISERVGSSGTGKELKQPAPDISHDATPPVPSSLPNAVDPFKEFMAQQANPSKPQLADMPAPTGDKPADPFKAFLENQKLQPEAARVSPFGK
jgi:hypothetical protein